MVKTSAALAVGLVQLRHPLSAQNVDITAPNALSSISPLANSKVCSQALRLTAASGALATSPASPRHLVGRISGGAAAPPCDLVFWLVQPVTSQTSG